MPKVNPYPLQERAMRVRACISRYMELRGITEDYLAKRQHVTKKTIQCRRKNPEKMQLEDIWELSQILKCPVEELCGGESLEEKMVPILSAIAKSAN